MQIVALKVNCKITKIVASFTTFYTLRNTEEVTIPTIKSLIKTSSAMGVYVCLCTWAHDFCKKGNAFWHNRMLCWRSGTNTSKAQGNRLELVLFPLNGQPVWLLCADRGKGGCESERSLHFVQVSFISKLIKWQLKS